MRPMLAMRRESEDAGEAVPCLKDSRPATLAGRIRPGHLDAPELPLTIETDVVLAYGVPMGATVEALRVAITESLARHTRFAAPRVDVRVRDVIIPEEDA